MAVLFIGTTSLASAYIGNENQVDGVDIDTGWSGNWTMTTGASSSWLLRTNICVSTLTLSTCTCEPNIVQIIEDANRETIPDRDEPWSGGENPVMTSVEHHEYTTGDNFSTAEPWITYGNISSGSELLSSTPVITASITGLSSGSEYLTITPSMSSFLVSTASRWNHKNLHLGYFNTTKNLFKSYDNSSLNMHYDASTGVDFYYGGAETEPYDEASSSEPCDDSSSTLSTYEILTTESSLSESTSIDENGSEISTSATYNETINTEHSSTNLNDESTISSSSEEYNENLSSENLHTRKTTTEHNYASPTTERDYKTSALELSRVITSLRSSLVSISTDCTEGSADNFDSSLSISKTESYIDSSTIDDCDEIPSSEAHKAIRSGYSIQNSKGTQHTIKTSTSLNWVSLTSTSNYSPVTTFVTTETPILHSDYPTTSEGDIVITSHATPTKKTIQTQYDDWSNYWDEEEWSEDWSSDLWRDIYKDVEQKDEQKEQKDEQSDTRTSSHKQKTTLIDRWMYTYTGSKKYQEIKTTSPLTTLGSLFITSGSGFTSLSGRSRKIIPTTESIGVEHHTEQLPSTEPSSLNVTTIVHSTSTHNTQSYLSYDLTTKVSLKSEEEPITTSLATEDSWTRRNTHPLLATESLNIAPSRISSKTFTKGSGKHGRTSRTGWKSTDSKDYNSVILDTSIVDSEPTIISSSMRSRSYKHSSKVRVSSKLAGKKHTPTEVKTTRVYSYQYLPKKSTDFISMDPSSLKTDSLTHIKVEQTLSVSTSESIHEISTSTLARPWYKSKPKNETVQHLSNASYTSVFYLLIIPCLSFFVIL